MNTDREIPFLLNALEPGVYAGISGGTQFNRGCASHSPSSADDDDDDETDSGGDETTADD